MALCTPGTPRSLNLCYCGRQGRQAYPSRHTRWGAASLPCLMLDAGGPGMSTCDKELHKPQFFACPPHKSIIYIHNFTYFSSTYQVHLMWNNKLLDLIWRWIQNFTTPHEINKAYDFNWTKNKCLSCFCHSETCDSELSFHESKQPVPEVNAISSDFLCMNFWCESFVLFPEIFVRQKCLVFCVCVCVHMY